MASNKTTLLDQDGEYADWVEIYNPDGTADNLGGWYLTDRAGNLTKWQIPSVSVPAGGYLVIFCSSKNDTDTSEPLAANFTLGASGGYLALVQPDGVSIASSYSYPVQYPDISYGVSQPTAPGESPQVGYFATATPGAANGGNGNVLLADMVAISAPGGLFTGTKMVSLSGATGSEHIRYALVPPSASGDAVAAPTAASTLYTGPISITSAVLLKAAVFSGDDGQRGLPASAMYVPIDTSSANRVDTFSSNMPLVVFDDNGFGLLPNNHLFYPGWQAAFSPSGGVSTLAQAPDFFTPDTFKLHGFSSATWPKQSYNSDLCDTLGRNAPETFFGMASDEDWDNISSWNIDRTYIHNTFVYTLARDMGYWAPQTRFAEMFIHSGGGPLDYTSYSGITNLSERIDVEPTRLNIFALSPTDTTAPDVTGGYVLRIDHVEPAPAPGAYTYYTWTTTRGQTVMVDSPKFDVLAPAQENYISNYVQNMEDAMASDQASGYATRNYLNFLDRSSWVDYHLLNVFVENCDSFRYSEYFNKDVNGLVKAGPVWDYDRSMGSADGRDVNPLQWTPNNDGDFWNMSWWTYVTHDPDFMQAWIDRWQGLRLSLFSNSNLASLIDSISAEIGPAAAARDSARWTANQSRFPGGWEGEIANMSSWISQRTQWIDQQFVPAPIANLSDLGVVMLPQGGAQIAYTLDGSDPRLSGGALSGMAQLSGAAVTIPPGQAFQARSYDASQAGAYPGSPWSSPLHAATVAANDAGSLTNVSCRAQVGTGASVLIEGFTVNGPAGASVQVLLRGDGPSLAQFGITGYLDEPVLTVYGTHNAVIATNTGWSSDPDASAVAAAANTVGAFGLSAGSADSALLLSLSPGAYTMVISGANQTTGIALGEIYEVSENNSQIVNISSRAQATTDQGVLIGGFVIGGGSAQVLVRGIGPGLGVFGVPNTLAKPVLQVLDSAKDLLGSNTGWSGNSGTEPAAASVAGVVGAFKLTVGSSDSALVLTLPPGAYSTLVSGLQGTTGNAMVEVYLAPSD